MSTVDDTATEPYTPLYEDIRRLGVFLQGHVPSHIPSPSEIAGTLGAIISYLEHGTSITHAARELNAATQEAHDQISKVLTQNEPEPVIGGHYTDANQTRVNQQQARELAELKAQMEKLTAALGASVVDQARARGPVDQIAGGNVTGALPPDVTVAERISSPAPVETGAGFGVDVDDQALDVAPDPTTSSPASAPIAGAASTAPSVPSFPTPASPSTPSDQEGAA